MYSQSNNRIVTKYSEYLKAQKDDVNNLEVEEVPPAFLPKTVNSFPSSDIIEVDEFGRSDDSGRESSLPNSNSSLTIISAQVHKTQSSPDHEIHQSQMISKEYKSSKFSELFSPDESHALFQRNLLIQSEEGAFLRDALVRSHVKSKSESDLVPDTVNIRRRSSASVHVESVVEARSLPTKVAVSPSLALDLRRELLNNIRAISRATFYEKLYMGGAVEEGAESSDTNNNPSTTVADEELEEFLRTGSPASTSHIVVSEKGELLVFENTGTNPDKVNTAVESPQPPRTQSDKESSIHQWILNSRHESETDHDFHDSPLNNHEPRIQRSLELDASALDPRPILHQGDSEAETLQPTSYDHSSEKLKDDALHDAQESLLDQSHPPDFTDSITRESAPSEFQARAPFATSPVASESPTLNSELALSTLTLVASEYPSTHAVSEYPPSTQATSKYPLTHVASEETLNPVASEDPSMPPALKYPPFSHATSEIPPHTQATYETPVLVSELASKNHKVPNVTSQIVSEHHVIPVTSHENLRKAERKSTFNKLELEQQTYEPGGRRSSIFTPIFRKVEINSPPPNREPPLSFSKGSPSFSLSPVVADASTQVRYPPVLAQRSPQQERKHIFRGPLPGVLLRTNMEQWVAKILKIYINGDEHFRRTEFRFRPGRDVHTFDALCDILSLKFNLTRGVRFLFTLDGKPIWSIDDLKHGDSYVVSSTKKFKALNYGGELVRKDEGSNKRRNRPPSAPTSRNPPIIRVRRERSLNGVAWGSPQQESSGSEGRAKLQNEAEKVLRAAIHETQLQNPAAKIVIRIINGSDPTIQSQVLLNTRVSEEWEDLVKDLGLAVKISRTKDSRMETLTGRPIQSYSQLRSQLKAGNQAFYIYNASQTRSYSTQRGKGRTGNATTFQSSDFGTIISLPKSQSHPSLPVVENSLGLKFPNSILHVTPKPNKLTVPPQHSTHYNSQPNLLGARQTQRRKSTRERYEKSRYLGHRSRSPSP